MRLVSIKSVFCLILSMILVGCSKSTTPDVVFYNGTIVTVDAGDATHQAVAVKDGKISFVGDSAEVLTLVGKGTKKIDLKGDTLIPGFIGVHEHPTLEALFANTIDISGFTHQTAEQMWQHLETQVSHSQQGEWVFAMGIDSILFPDMQLPTMADLDRIAPQNPLVLISQTMHSYWANSQAFAEVGITASTPDPGYGSYYGKDENGQLTGFIAESEASAPFLEELKSPLATISNYEKVLDEYLAAGYTTVASLGYNVPTWIAKYAAFDWFQYKIRQFYYLTASELDMLPEERENGDDYFSILGVKIWHDGSPYTGSMQLEQPYTTSQLTESIGIEPGHSGEPRLSDEKFTSQVEKYSQQGWQLAVHSQGDLSSRLVTEVMSSVAKPEFKEQRHRIEHGLLISKDSLEQMAAIGLTPSFHINHIYYYGDALSEGIIGPQRAKNVLLVKDAFDLNMHPTLHADGPMFPAAPFHLMQTSMTRKSRTGLALGQSQGISSKQALKALTYNGAWQLGLDTKLGSIEVGKYADFVRLSDNPLSYPLEQLIEIQVLETWVEGEPKFIK
ncbi:MAG: amidohydrolase [Paraglaciecola sp.]|uniref:amidohydrolase n=1 Tax=Paraglaciecola sp. TaxID=1920173 RepID=UPI00329A4E3B